MKKYLTVLKSDDRINIIENKERSIAFMVGLTKYELLKAYAGNMVLKIYYSQNREKVFHYASHITSCRVVGECLEFMSDIPSGWIINLNN